MTFKKLSRAGLVGSRAARFCSAILLSLPTFHALLRADAGAPRLRRPRRLPRPRPPRPRRRHATPRCYENCTPNSGDTAWMLTSVALVLMMTIPGLGLFYGGMVRKKNVGDTVMTSFAITCLVSILWLVFTYSLAFRAGTPFIGGLDRAFLQGIVSDIAKRHRQSQSAGADDPRDRLHRASS